MTEPVPLRVALVGYGLAGRWFHRPLLDAAPGLEVGYVVTANDGRRREATTDLPEAEVLPAVDDLWARRDGIDLVVVAAANAAHVPVAEAAVEHGLPVVVDKPLAVTAAHGRRLADLAAVRGVLLTVFQNRRWDSDTRSVARLLAEDALGPVVRFDSHFERFRPVPRDRWRESGDPALGGGTLLDLGSHLVDQAVLLFGPVVAVYAEVRALRPGADGDDDVFLALEHGSGVRSHLRAGMVAPAPAPRVRVQGLRAGYVKAEPDGQEDALRAGRRPGEPGWGAAPPGRLYHEAGVREVASLPGDWPAFYPAVAEAVRGGGPPPVDPYDAVRVLEVLEAARTSARRREVVRLPP